MRFACEMIQAKLQEGSSHLVGSERISSLENETLRLETQLLGSSVKKKGGRLLRLSALERARSSLGVHMRGLS